VTPVNVAAVRIALACAITLASSDAALAHAALHHASPGGGSTVSESPREVTLTFTDTLEAAFSSADVTDSSGARVDEGKPQVNGNMILHCPQNAVAGKLSRSLAGGLCG
jgi:methionine-rich copper-binding protein CopC